LLVIAQSLELSKPEEVHTLSEPTVDRLSHHLRFLLVQVYSLQLRGKYVYNCGAYQFFHLLQLTFEPLATIADRSSMQFQVSGLEIARRVKYVMRQPKCQVNQLYVLVRVPLFQKHFNTSPANELKVIKASLLDELPVTVIKKTTISVQMH
jgi:hypothetical protein